MKGLGVSSQANALPSLFLLLLVLNITAYSQTTSPDAQPGPSPTPTPSLEKQFVRNILRDQVAIWTSPFHMSGGDMKLVVPIGLATAALIATDRRTANELTDNGGSQDLLRISHQVSHFGEFYSTGGIAAAFYLVGVKKHDYRARETGILGAEALIDAGIVVTVLKEITQRPRPNVPDPNDDFFDGGVSFPSGHAITTFALATVIASEYHDHKAVQIAAYGYATAVAISRYTGRNHFLSDVLVGSALGYGIGHYVYKKHHIAESDLTNGQTKHGFMHSKWVPFASPIYSGRDHTYGLALAWGH